MQRLQHIADLGPLLASLGCRHVVISPGSRNAPLIQLFTSDQRFRCHSIVDERSAAYVALGMARQTGKPAIVVTTSGTAVLNAAPAVAEAFHQRVPLVVLTADRPREPIPAFTNQWIDQQAPYYSFSKGFLELPAGIGQPEQLNSFMTQAARLVSEAARYPAGPVHINILLDEPLYDPLPGPSPGAGAVNHRIAEDPAASPADASPDPSPGEKILILAGLGPPNPSLEKQLKRWVRSRGAVVVAENLSNMTDPGFVRHPELLLAAAGPEEAKELMPDRVVSVGGQVVSKRLRLFLQSAEDLRHQETDGDPVAWLTRLGGEAEGAPGKEGSTGKKRAVGYAERWKSAERDALKQSKEKVSRLPFGNLYATARVLERVPGGTTLHLGNSASVRLTHLFQSRTDVHYYSNRGTSGIDGCLSAAVGAAMASEGTHLLLVGDLSFVYDSNGLWNKDFPENLKIVVLNDGGGGIFRLLEGPSRMDFFEEFSVTRHPVSLELLSQAFGHTPLCAASPQELEAGLDRLLTPGSSATVLEVDTTKCENPRIFKEFFDFKR